VQTFLMFLELKRLRLISLLTQGDVSIETGIPVRRLSLAERGLVRLSEAENRLLRELFSRRMALLESPEPASAEREDGNENEQ